MTIFTRNINAAPTQHRDSLRAAYTQAGKPAPDNTTEIRELIINAPKVRDVAIEKARKAYDADNPEKFYREALKAVQEAQAAEALRDAFISAEVPVIAAKMNDTIDAAVEALTPAFNRETKALTAAATKLDPNNPLDPETAIALDAGEALTTARRALKVLSKFASIHGHYPHELNHQALRNVLPIITLPDNIEVEEVYKSLGAVKETANEHELAATRTVRRLADDLKADTDATLIRVAAGHYEGVTLHLATTAEHRERHQQAHTAFQRRTVEKSGTRVTFG